MRSRLQDFVPPQGLLSLLEAHQPRRKLLRLIRRRHGCQCPLVGARAVGADLVRPPAPPVRVGLEQPRAPLAALLVPRRVRRGEVQAQVAVADVALFELVLRPPQTRGEAQAIFHQVRSVALAVRQHGEVLHCRAAAL